MEKIKKIEWFKGDKVLWIAIILISIASIFPVYSASSQLEYVQNEGNTFKHIGKHIVFIILGIFVMGVIERTIKYEAIGKLSNIFLFIFGALVGYTAFKGGEVAGASAGRWLFIPGIGLGFQPSSFAFLFLIIYLCRYLTKKIDRDREPYENIIYIFGPILIVFGLVAKDNGSMAAMILAVSLLVLIFGQLEWKYILGFAGISTVLTVFYVLLALNTNIIPENMNRVHTWKSRVESYLGIENEDSGKSLKDKNFQIERATAAIINGGFIGKGPGQSVMKHNLSQSPSDFIFSIIVEEYGFLGTLLLLLFYSILIFRAFTIARKMPTFFGTLLALSMALMFFVQVCVHIAVSLRMFPVTGQPLPFISYGGSALLVNYIQFGIILNISSRIQLYNEEGIGKKQNIEEINDIA